MRDGTRTPTWCGTGIAPARSSGHRDASRRGKTLTPPPEWARMTSHVCVFEGDDAAPEAVRPTVDLLSGLGVDLAFAHPPVEDHAGALDRGELPDELRDAIDGADTVLFGAARDRHLPVIRYLRRDYAGGTFANVRPIRSYPGARAPLADHSAIDYTIVRENLEGLYVGVEGDVGDLRTALSGSGIDGHDRLADVDPGTFAVRAHGEAGVRRIAAFAADRAAARPGETVLTCATKSNVLPRTDGRFDEAVAEAAADRDGVVYEHLHADDVAHQQVIDPGRFDVIVAPNSFGDVLSDLGAGTIGGLGLAPSGCYGDAGAYFEPVHGTAPDIAGEGIINPTATILSGAMLLEYLGEEAAGAAVRDAVAETYVAGEVLTPDQGGTASTEAFVDAVAARL